MPPQEQNHKMFNIPSNKATQYWSISIGSAWHKRRRGERVAELSHTSQGPHLRQMQILRQGMMYLLLSLSLFVSVSQNVRNFRCFL